jgi:polyisoprenoid-binding protein YceI
MTHGVPDSDGVRKSTQTRAPVTGQPSSNLSSAIQRPPSVSDIRLDAESTAVTFAVRWLGALTVRGRFTELEGTLRIPDGCVEAAEVAIDVAAASVRTGIGLRDRHLRGPQFLDAARYPRITFRSTRVEHPNGILIVSGLISLRGRDHGVSAPSTVEYVDGAGEGPSSLVRLRTGIIVPRRLHGIGVARGVQRLNPLLYAIGTTVAVRIDVRVLATRLLPALLPALGR